MHTTLEVAMYCTKREKRMNTRFGVHCRIPRTPASQHKTVLHGSRRWPRVPAVWTAPAERQKLPERKTQPSCIREQPGLLAVSGESQGEEQRTGEEKEDARASPRSRQQGVGEPGAAIPSFTNCTVSLAKLHEVKVVRKKGA